MDSEENLWYDKLWEYIKDHKYYIFYVIPVGIVYWSGWLNGILAFVRENAWLSLILLLLTTVVYLCYTYYAYKSLELQNINQNPKWNKYKFFKSLFFVLVFISLCVVEYLYYNQLFYNYLFEISYFVLIITLIILLGEFLKKMKTLELILKEGIRDNEKKLTDITIECNSQKPKIDMYNQLEQKYDSKFLDNLLNIDGVKYLKRQIRYMSKIDEKQKNANKLEKLSHIMYNLINDNNFSLHEVSHYDVIKNHLPKNLIESFNFSVGVLSKIEDHSNSYAWYVNVVDPDTWNRVWENDYFLPFLNMACTKHNIRIKRIHLLEKKAENTIFMKLYEVLLTEQLFGIDNKALIVNSIKPDKDHIALRLSDIFVMDYAILRSWNDSYYVNNNDDILTDEDILAKWCQKNYTTSSKSQKKINNKTVLCSDFQFEEVAQPGNKVYVLKDFYSFGLFKDHFLCLWNLNEFITFIDSKINNENNNNKELKLKAEAKIKHFFDMIKDSQAENELELLNYTKIAGYIINHLSANEGEDHEKHKIRIAGELKTAMFNFRSGIIHESNMETIRKLFNDHFKKLIIRPSNI